MDYSRKTVKTQLGAIEAKVPRDRNGEYEPQIISEYSRNADRMEEKILALYSCGMSQRGISEQMDEPNIFCGLVFCAGCGRPMVLHRASTMKKLSSI